MQMPNDFKAELKRIKKIRKQLSKIRVGLPIKVQFDYYKGTVTMFPKVRTWVVEPKNKKRIVHIIPADQRIDVTKHKARHLLKLAILGVLRSD